MNEASDGRDPWEGERRRIARLQGWVLALHPKEAERRGMVDGQDHGYYFVVVSQYVPEHVGSVTLPPVKLLDVRKAPRRPA